MHDGPELSAEDAYVFRHALMRDAAYQLQLPGDRASSHWRAFLAIESALGRPQEPPALGETATGRRPSYQSDVFAAELALHLRLAQHPDPHQLAALRCLYLRRAAEHAEYNFAAADAFPFWMELAGLCPAPEQPHALRLAGVAATQAGRMADAEFALGKAAELAREQGNLHAESMALASIGPSYLLMGRFAEADAALSRALEITRAQNNRKGEVLALINLATIQRDSGRATEAEANFALALSAAHEVGDRHNEGYALTNLAILHLTSTRLAEAAIELERAAVIARETGDLRLECGVLLNQAIVCNAMGDAAAAQGFSARGMALLRKVGDRRMEAIVNGNVAQGHRMRGEFGAAHEGFLRTLHTAREGGYRTHELQLLLNLTELHLAWDKPLETVEYAGQANALAQELGSRHQAGMALGWGAIALVQLGRLDEARHDWQLCAEHLTAADAPGDLTRLTNTMRQVCTPAMQRALDEPMSGPPGASFQGSPE